MSKRKMKRRHLIYYLRVYDKKTEALIGHLADITTDGIMIMSESPVQTGVDFSFRMTLPAEIEGNKEICFEASSIWSKKDVNPDFYASGFKISNIDLKDSALIEELIVSYGFRD